jgi:hypothetical protein
VRFANKKQDAKTCGINHRGDEFILEPNSFYILAKTSPVQQAFPSPILDAAWLYSNFVDYLKNQTKDANEWLRLFALVKLTLQNCEGSVGAIQVDQHQHELDQPLRTLRRPHGRLRLGEVKVVNVNSEGESIKRQGPPIDSGLVWDNIPDTPFINAEEFLTEEERESWATEPASFPTSIIRTIKAMQEGIEQNATDLVTMHSELSSHWLIIAEDMRKIEGKQTLLQGQLEGQSVANQASDLTPSNYADLDAKLSWLLRDLPNAETRLQNLELSSQSLEANNATLTSSVVSLQAQNQMLTDQLGAALLLPSFEMSRMA